MESLRWNAARRGGGVTLPLEGYFAQNDCLLLVGSDVEPSCPRGLSNLVTL